MVQDILSALEKRVKEGKLQSQVAPGNMKLYIRERGQGELQTFNPQYRPY
jgi:hypothetical protein